jgi:hypothetical protein
MLGAAMSSPPPPLPEGFVETASEGLLVWAPPGLAEAAVAATDPSLGHAGRGRVRFAALGGASEGARVAVRHYVRGGALGPLLGDLQRDGRRPLREIALYAAARAAGVPTLEPIAGVSRRASGPFWRCDLVTREEAGARDLGERLAGLLAGPVATRRRAIAAAARAVRALHEAGFDHADLNLKNVLLVEGEEGTGEVGGAGAGAGRGEGAGEVGGAGAGGGERAGAGSGRKGGREVRALVIDLDGARRREGPLEEGRRVANLLRLYRSAVKLARLGGFAPPARREALAFARAYAGPDRALLRRIARVPLPTFGWRKHLWRRA